MNPSTQTTGWLLSTQFRKALIRVSLMNLRKHACRSVYFLIYCLTAGVVPTLHAGPLDRWTSRSITNFPWSSLSFSSLAYGAQGFVALASGPVFPSSNVWTSADGSQWTGYAIPDLASVEGIAYGNGSYVAVGSVPGYPNLGYFGHSTSGTSWTGWLAPAGLRAVAYGNGKYVAVGDFGAVYTVDTQFNGTSNSPPVMDSLRGITYGGGRFVAVGDMGRVMISTNGQTWQTNTLPFPSPPLSAVAYGNGYYVAVGMSGAVWRSSDGLNWSDYSPGAFSDLRGIGFGEGVFVAVGWNGSIYTSTDGASWISRNSGLFMPPNFNDVAYGNGSFVVVGDFSTILQSGALNGRPEILQQPQSLTASPGAFVSFGAVATGVAPLHYQWSKNGTNVSGAINSILSVTNVQLSDAGDYRVTVTNVFGFDSSAVATLTVTAAFPLDFWHWRNPLPQGNDIIDVVYGNGRFVEATVDGAVGLLFDGYSLGGVSRMQVDWPFNSLQSLSFANGLFFAGSGSILSSGDGISWSGSNSFPGVTSVAYGNGVYVAIRQDYGPAQNYGLIYSTDGVNWTNSNYNLSSYSGQLVFANGIFVAVGNGLGVFTSVDGINWTSRGSFAGRYLQSIAYGNQLFVIVGEQGDVFTSPDGIHWTLRNSFTQNSLWKVTFANGRFVAVGDGGTIITSVDGINWLPTDTAAFSGYALTSVAGGGGRFVAVGLGGVMLASSDAIIWTAISRSVTPQPLYSCASGGGTVVSVGYFGTVLTSVNGMSWSNQNSGTLEPLNKVLHAAGRFVAVGGEGTILTSPNGTNWVARVSGTVAGLNGIAYGNGMYVAVGNGVVLSSADATNWSVIREGNLLNAITFGTNLFVAVGENGLIISSTNLAQWQTNMVSTSQSLYGVTYGNAQFVAVGNQSTIVRASAPFFGTPFWSTVPQTGFPESFFDVTYDYGEFVAVGADLYGYYNSSSSPSVIASSEDGQTWTNRFSPSSNPLYGVTAFGNSFVTVGDYGTILQSDSFTTLSLGIQITVTNNPLPMPVVQLTVTGTPGFRYVIESSDSLSNPGAWFPMVPDFVLTNSPQIMTLPIAGPLQQQGFFRARRSMLP